VKVVLPTPFMTEVISSSTAAVTSPNRVIPYVSVATSVRKAAAGLMDEIQWSGGDNSSGSSSGSGGVEVLT